METKLPCQLTEISLSRSTKITKTNWNKNKLNGNRKLIEKTYMQIILKHNIKWKQYENVKK